MVMPQFCIGIFLLLGIKTLGQFCPYPNTFYIKRGVNTYCQKIYNCKPGYEIRPCDKSCKEEICIPCPTGTYQPFLSHSDDPIRKQCFKPDLECNPRDTFPVENGTYPLSCARQSSCACNHGKCFHGNPCQCERNFKPCGINKEMDYKGKCVKCMEGYMKPYRGCNQCDRIVPTPPKFQGETEGEEGQTLNISSNRCFIGFREIEGVCTECIGFYGEECSIPCPAGYYGRQCKVPCNCSSNDTCNQFVGCRSNSTRENCKSLNARKGGGSNRNIPLARQESCHENNICCRGYRKIDIFNSSFKCCLGFRKIEDVCTECIGFYGEECSIPCPAGFYGRQCKTPCNCSSNEACNQFVGCRSNSTCGEGHHSVKGNLKWMLMIFFICLQGFNLVFCIGYPLRKRKNWIRKMMIRKMEKCRGCFLFSQQKGKTVRNKGHSDSHPMHRSADYGYVGDGYHQIHFPN